MRKLLPAFLLLAFCFIGNTIIAQTSVSLQINHKLGESDFAFDMESADDMNSPFKLTRTEYYMSGFTVYHDGTSTAIDGLNFLVRANEETTLDLGMIEATEVTQIRFHIGISEDLNHEDPAGYSPSSPLSPQNPSMHWGWAAGYRFIAMEGDAGANFNNGFEFHGLGDVNYFETSVDVAPMATTDGITIRLDADYTKAFENIDISSGVISHGETGEAKTAVENFRDYVFTESVVTAAITDYAAVSALQIFPNPTMTNAVSVSIEMANESATQLELFRADGSLVSTSLLNNQATVSLQLEAKGFYFLRVSQDGKTVAYEKVVAQ